MIQYGARFLCLSIVFSKEYLFAKFLAKLKARETQKSLGQRCQKIKELCLDINIFHELIPFKFYHHFILMPNILVRILVLS